MKISASTATCAFSPSACWLCCLWQGAAQTPVAADQPVRCACARPIGFGSPVSVAVSGTVEANVTAQAHSRSRTVARVYVEEGQR